MDSTAKMLTEVLASALPKDFHCKVRYICTPPKLCDSLFPPPPSHDPEKTQLASHFLAVGTLAGDRPDPDQSESDLLVLGIEVYIYTIPHLTTIFVSKADSTGFIKLQKPSPVRTIATTFLHWLATQQQKKHPARQIVISLFARAQAQYLFPGSAENGKKHVLDDRQLIRWWARVLDPILTRNGQGQASESSGTAYQAWMTVPGYEGNEVRQFFPPRDPSASQSLGWKPGNPLAILAETRNVPKDAMPRTLLPRFPDDPKARFMQDLDDEVGIASDPTTVSPSKRKHGNWKNISNLDRFWEAMEFRQECSSGRMVGFLWLVMTPKLSDLVNGANVGSQESLHIPDDGPTSEPVLPSSQSSSTPNGSPKKRKRKLLSGPIVTRQPRLKGSSSTSNVSNSDLNGMVNSVRGDGLILTKEGYDQAMQTLLNLDFGSAEAAARSTAKWAEEIRSICGLSGDWAILIQGSAPPPPASQSSGGGEGAAGKVNDLGGMVRKKRKVADEAVPDSPAVAETSTQATTDERPTANILGAGIIRKKPKPTAA